MTLVARKLGHRPLDPLPQAEGAWHFGHSLRNCGGMTGKFNLIRPGAVEMPPSFGFFCAQLRQAWQTIDRRGPRAWSSRPDFRFRRQPLALADGGRRDGGAAPRRPAAPPSRPGRPSPATRSTIASIDPMTAAIRAILADAGTRRRASSTSATRRRSPNTTRSRATRRPGRPTAS